MSYLGRIAAKGLLLWGLGIFLAILIRPQRLNVILYGSVSWRRIVFAMATIGIALAIAAADEWIERRSDRKSARE